GLAARDGEAPEDQLGPDAEGLGAVHRHQQRGRGPVGELRRVAGGDAARAALVEDGRQREQAFERRVGAVALVLLDVVRLLAGLLTGLLVEDGPGDVHRRQLLLEEALLLRARRALLGRPRVPVLRLARDLVALGHDFARVARRPVDAGPVLVPPRVR